MLEVYVQMMHREQPQVRAWQQRGTNGGQMRQLTKLSAHRLGKIFIQIGERFVQWSETLRMRNDNLAPRIYPQ